MGVVSSTATGPVALPTPTPTAEVVRMAGYRPRTPRGAPPHWPVPPEPDMHDPRQLVDRCDLADAGARPASRRRRCYTVPNGPWYWRLWVRVVRVLAG